MNSSSGATSYMKASDDEAIILSGDVVILRVEPVFHLSLYIYLI